MSETQQDKYNILKEIAEAVIENITDKDKLDEVKSILLELEATMHKQDDLWEKLYTKIVFDI